MSPSIVVNGRPHPLEVDPMGLSDLLARLGLNARYVVVELNGDPVERRHVPEVLVHAGDRLEVVRAVAGGRR